MIVRLGSRVLRVLDPVRQIPPLRWIPSLQSHQKSRILDLSFRICFKGEGSEFDFILVRNILIQMNALISSFEV